jgi:hypothetical protein
LRYLVEMADERLSWALLVYRLPREPSTPRIALWRKLKRLGAAQVQDSLVALPLDSRNREQLEWLAEEVGEAGGEATVWVAQTATARQERVLVERMSGAVAADYRAVIDAAATAREKGADRRALGRLRRSLRAIRARDYFPPPEREKALRAVESLGELVEAPQR